MTNLIGNTCLVLAALVSSAIVSSSFNYRPPHGGSGGVAAYPIWMLLLHFGLLCILAVATIAIARKGGFDWISPYRIIRYVLVTIGLFSAILAMMLSSGVMEHPGGEALWLQMLSRFTLVAFPVVLIGSGFILLNESLRASVPAFTYKWSLTTVFAVSMFFVGTAVYEWIVDSQKGLNDSQRSYENAPAIQADRLRQIEEADIREDMVRMLELTGDLYAPEVRAKAVEKVKTHPAWDKELVSLLEDNHALVVFNFLASNEVPDKKMFLEPVRKGVQSVADGIRYAIQGTSSYYRDSYLNEVERSLRTVERFSGMGVDYLPEVKQLRAALDEPTNGEAVKFEAVGVLEEWMKGRE